MAQRSYREEYYPKESLEKCEENIEDFFKFMYERHTIWHRRFIEKLPREEWTNNEIFKTTKYTNVYRQLDRGTLWYLDKVVKPYKKIKKKNSDNKEELEKNFKNLIWKTCLYRLCNRIETFEEIGLPNYYDFNPDEFFNGLKEINDRGQSVMTSAHLTCPTPKGLKKYEGYTLACFDLYNKLDQLYEKIINAEYPEEIFLYVKGIHCIGAFTSYEIYCDLCYSKAIPFTTNDFVNVGPGAKEGIRLLFPSTKGLDNIELKLRQLHKDQHYYFEKYKLDFPFYNNYEPVENELSLRSIEHSLCEYSKYWLQCRGLGKVRMIFNPDHHDSIITEDGSNITTNSDDSWKEKVYSRRTCKVENPLIKLLKDEGLTKDEMKEFIKELRQKKEADG